MHGSYLGVMCMEVAILQKMKPRGLEVFTVHPPKPGFTSAERCEVLVVFDGFACLVFGEHQHPWADWKEDKNSTETPSICCHDLLDLIHL